MANYYSTSRTNYFKVTDEARFDELFKNLISIEDDEVYDFTKTNDGVKLHAFGSYGSINYCIKPLQDEDDDYDLDFDSFLTELQKILPDDEAFIYTECGYEKLRYIRAFSIVVTRTKIKTVDLCSDAVRLARNMLKNKKFQTEMTY